jgi:glutamate mutase epsilon subunit
LLNEIALAGGYTWTESHALGTLESYCKNERPENVIRQFQYVSRLVGCYEEKGVPIAAFSIGGGAMTDRMTPPSAMVASAIVSLLMLPAQGVKHTVTHAYSGGNIAQDVANAFVLRKLCRKYLDQLGYKDVDVFYQGCELSGAHPLDHAQSFAEVLYSPVVAVLGGVDMCHIKTWMKPTLSYQENMATSLRGPEW